MSVSTILALASTALSSVVSIFKIWVNKTKNNNTDAMKANDRAKKIADIKACTRNNFDKGDVERIQQGTSK